MTSIIAILQTIAAVSITIACVWFMMEVSKETKRKKDELMRTSELLKSSLRKHKKSE